MFLATAAKIAARELRASPARSLFVIAAVAVGVAALSGIEGFGAAFRSTLLHNAKQLIAADLQAQTWNTPTPAEIQQTEETVRPYGQVTRVTETVSMAASAHQHIPQLVSVKAIDPALYPFYGVLTVDPSRPLASLLPDNSSAVVTPELLVRLKLNPGETVRLGGKEFRITGTMVTEPDRLASGFGPGMRILITRAGLERSGLVQYGSRAAQRFLVKLNPNAPLETLKTKLKAIFPHVYLSDFREGSPVVGKAVDNTTRFLSLISLIALIVGSLGVGMSVHAHIQQHLDTIGIMKALGGRSNQVLVIYALQSLALGIAGGLVGIAIGMAVQRSLPLLMRRALASLPPIAPDWSFTLQGMSIGILAAMLFTLPPLLSVRSVRPNIVFRREMQDALATVRAWRRLLPSVALSLVILGGFVGIAAWISHSWRMGVYFAGGLGLGILILLLAAALLLFLLRTTIRRIGNVIPGILRHGIANLYRPGNHAAAVLVALGVGVMFTLSTYLLQRTILRDILSETPAAEGNLFLMDMHDTDAVTKFIQSQPGIQGKLELVGSLGARIVTRNGKPPSLAPSADQREGRRDEVRLSTADAQPSSVHVLHGHWWPAGSQEPALAVSEEAQRRFGLKLGDQLLFQVNGRTLQVPVAALFTRESRSAVRYDLVLPSQAVKGYPVTYYGTVHANPPQIPAIEESLFERFPTVTVMNLADILQRVQQAVDQVAVVIRFLALFAVAAGVIILSSSIAGTRYRRIREIAILKTMGATRARIRNTFSVEFTVLGAVSGLIGGLLANLFTATVAKRFIEAPFSFDYTAVLISTLGTILLANIAGWVASANLLEQKPLAVLRSE